MIPRNIKPLAYAAPMERRKVPAGAVVMVTLVTFVLSTGIIGLKWFFQKHGKDAWYYPQQVGAESALAKVRDAVATYIESHGELPSQIDDIEKYLSNSGGNGAVHPKDLVH